MINDIILAGLIFNLISSFSLQQGVPKSKWETDSAAAQLGGFLITFKRYF